MNFLIFALINLLNLYSLVLLARVLLSWFPNIDQSNPIVQFLYQVTEPVLQPIRDVLPRTQIDFSPLVVFVLISVIARMLAGLAI